MPIVRNILAVFLGMLLGGIANILVLLASSLIWPMPEGMDMADPVQMQAFVAGLPVAALLFAVVAHLAQVVVGGAVAAKVGTAPLPLAMTIAGLSMIGGVMNLINLGAPAWMWGELPLYLLAGYGVGRAFAARDLS